MKPTKIDQRAWQGKQTLQPYSQILSEKEIYLKQLPFKCRNNTNESRIKGHPQKRQKMDNIYRLSEFYAIH